MSSPINQQQQHHYHDREQNVVAGDKASSQVHGHRDSIQETTRHRTTDAAPKEGAGLFLANYDSVRPHFQEELSIIAAPIVHSADQHSNDSVISIRSGHNDDNVASDAPNQPTLEGGQVTATNDDSRPQPAHHDNSNNNDDNININGGGQWMMNVPSQISQEMRQRVSMASDQLGLSIRQLYASAASSMASQVVVDVPPSYHNIPGIVPYYRGRSSGPPPSYDEVINPYAAPPTYQSLFGQMREASKNSRGFIDLLKRLVILSTIGCSLLLAFVVLVPFSMILVGVVYLNDCRIEHIPGFLLAGGLVWASKNIIHCCAQCRDDDVTVDGEELPDYGYYEEQQQQQQQQHSTASTDVISVASVDTNTMASGEIHQEISAPDVELTLRQISSSSPRATTTANRRATKSSICESVLNCILFGWFVAGCVIVFKNNNPDFEDPGSPRFCNRTVYMFTFWLISSGLVVFTLFVTCICCLMISSAIATRHDDDLS